MAPDRRSRRSRTNRWYRQNVGGQQEIVIQDTIAGDRLRRVLDSYCPFCATNIRSVGPRNIVRCPNVSICGKALPIDSNSCPNCTHYTRPGDNFCRICRTNLRGIVRGHGGLYQQLGRAPSPFQNISPPRQEPAQEEESEEETEEGNQGNAIADRPLQFRDFASPRVILHDINAIINQANRLVNDQQ